MGPPTVLYSSRVQADKLLEHARATGSLEGISFAQKRDPCDSFFKKLKTVWEPDIRNSPGHYNLGVALHSPVHSTAKDGLKEKSHKTLTSTSDQSRMLEFDLETLEPFGVTDQTKLHPSLNGELSAAHPEKDPVTGDVFNFNLKMGPKSVYRLFRTDATTGSTDILATFTGANPVYIHSQFLTANFHILCIWNSTLAMGGARILWERNILSAMEAFDSKGTAQWVVVDRRHGLGVVARFTSPAFFCFHTVNAWEVEKGDGKVDIVCELVKHPDLDILHHFYYEHLVSNGAQATKFGKAKDVALVRYTLPNVSVPTGQKGKSAGEKKIDITKVATTPAVEREIVKGAGGPELPTLNSAYNMKPHRFVYGAAEQGESTFFDSLVKVDTETGELIRWKRTAQTPGEAIFIPDPNGVDEDSGVLLSVVLDGIKGTSYLVCLNAKNLAELGRTEVGCAVGLGFHGCFLQN